VATHHLVANLNKILGIEKWVFLEQLAKLRIRVNLGFAYSGFSRDARIRCVVSLKLQITNDTNRHEKDTGDVA
jgi:hypothetical protein